MVNVTETDLISLKQFMRIDGNDEDALILSLGTAAKLYLCNAGIEAPRENPELYNLAFWSLTLHYYDHRDSVGNEAAIPAGLRPVLNQLKLNGDILCSIST